MAVSTTQIPVRKLFWDAFEMALTTQTYKLAKDVATALGKEPEPLLKALRDEKTKVYLFEEAADDDVEDLADFRCKHLVPHKENLAYCNEPVVWGKDKHDTCLEHLLNPSPYSKFSNLPVLKRVVMDDGITCYVDMKVRKIYDESGKQIGTT